MRNGRANILYGGYVFRFRRGASDDIGVLRVVGFVEQDIRKGKVERASLRGDRRNNCGYNTSRYIQRDIVCLYNI